MKDPVLRIFRLLAATAVAAGSAALLSGCKGNTTSAANVERAVPEPPAIAATLVDSDPRDADPLTDSTWRASQWLTLIAPSNTTHQTASVKAALLYDSSTLYVAFVNQKQPQGVTRDSVTLYLDTTSAANGTEMAQLQVDSTGKSSCTWIRAATPVMRRPDGTPDWMHPMSKIPDVAVKGLWSKVRQGTLDHIDVWTAVLVVPLHQLPLPLQVAASPGTHWKVNLVRTVLTDEGEHSELLQSNLSPVYVGAQAVSPYRMSDLQLLP